MEDQKKIGIFDSGIGGFSLLKELVNILPGHQYFYISDKPNSPYGNKSSDFIGQRCEVLTKDLINSEVDLILIACNTATAEGIDMLRQKFEIPFVGIEPFVKVIETFHMEPDFRPVVLTTNAMYESERFKALLNKFDPQKRIDPFPCEKLASLIEMSFEQGLSSFIPEIHEELRPLKGQSYTHAILGCTHYPLIKDLISEYLEVECLSPCLPVAKRVAHILKIQGSSRSTELNFKISNESSFSSLDPGVLSLR